nr:adenosylhomocysteinase [Planctomonas sp. JC2975]
MRRFARATNLLVPGRSFTVLGDEGRADALRGLLRSCGGRESVASPDYLFATTETSWQRAAGFGSPIVVDVAGSLTAEISGRAAPSTRDGILRLDGIDVVPAFPSLPAQAPLPAAPGRIAWAGAHMPLTASFAADLKRDELLNGRRIAVSMVLEPKTAVLALALRDAGADVHVFSHRYETDEPVAAHLGELGIPVFADARGDAATDRTLALRLLDTDPDVLIDDGAHVIRLAHKARPELVTRMIGAAEETTSGVRAIRALGDGLRMPVVAVNDAVTKTRFDNRYGTGQSCVFALADTLESVAGLVPATDSFDDAVVAVLGFGPVGQGVAQFARALGARVRVADVDPRAELEARYAGYSTGAAAEILPGADIVFSATGVARTITAELVRLLDEAVLAVAGGVDDEIEVDRLRRSAHTARAGDHVETFTFDDGRVVTVVDDGECVNITAGEGNPIEIMDLSFAAQLQALRTLLTGRDLPPELMPLPVEADREIARRALPHRRAGQLPAGPCGEGAAS